MKRLMEINWFTRVLNETITRNSKPEACYQLCEKKRGSINTNLSPILERLQVEPKHWVLLA